jgi:23S rRNA (guanosine2251-2'-O)-methyltransferase
MINSRFPKKSMDELNRCSPDEYKNADHFPIWLLLEDVRSMHNVGSAFRTADAFNISGIYLCGYTPFPPHRDIHKTALGATESVFWQYEKDTVKLLQQLKGEGCAIYALEQTHNSIALPDFSIDAKHKTVLIFGNEASGVSDEALTFCEASIEIPQWGTKHSLNIAVSVGVALWEMVRKL